MMISVPVEITKYWIYRQHAFSNELQTDAGQLLTDGDRGQANPMTYKIITRPTTHQQTSLGKRIQPSQPVSTCLQR